MKETQTKEQPTKELACTLQRHQDHERQDTRNYSFEGDHKDTQLYKVCDLTGPEPTKGITGIIGHI